MKSFRIQGVLNTQDAGNRIPALFLLGAGMLSGILAPYILGVIGILIHDFELSLIFIGIAAVVMPSLNASKPGLRVRIYGRVSTEDQVDNYSIPAQLDRCRDYAHRAQWAVAGEYIDDGKSGRNTRRPAYQRMMREAQRGDVILVAKMDRIHRNSRNFMLMIDELEKREISFASVNENIDTSTAIGRFVMQVIQLIAQLESEQIGERVKEGQRKKIRTERCYPYPAPSGFINKNGNLAPHPQDAKLLETAFERCAAGVPIRHIAMAVNVEMRTRFGNEYSDDQLREILRNPVNIGVLQAGNFVRTFNHAAIVPVNVFLATQKVLDSRGGKVIHRQVSAAWLAARLRAIEATRAGVAYEETFEA